MEIFSELQNNEPKKIQGFIYKIQKKGGGGLIYIGSTRQSQLSKRMNNHRTSYRAYKEGKYSFVSVFKLFDVYSLENCEIDLIETYYFNNREELVSRERFFIEKYRDKCVNINIPSRKWKERYDNNRDVNLERFKQYYEEHKDDLLEYRKQYYEEHKDDILEWKNTNNKCDCGGNFTNANKCQHLKTKKHLKYLEAMELKDYIDELKSQPKTEDNINITNEEVKLDFKEEEEEKLE